MPPVLVFVSDRRQHLHMPKDCFPKLTSLMPSFGKNTTPRWSCVCRSYCTRKYPRKTCHHTASAPHSGGMDARLSKRQEKDISQVRLEETLGCWWLKHSGEAADGQSSHPGASTAQLRMQLVLDQIRKEPWEMGTLSLSSEISCDNCPAQGTFTQSLKVLKLWMGHDGT